ncbi:MAG: RidA family protein [Planctomycetota bacterium]|nr:MAG: RidA family protein [Planctomycetota bacterium]REJ95899.1 MAG: RidA family protein [Planctomycetota bacterium]REK25287.1 MAG: RidA family protein [Planctomycetota bacterium]REK37983.1 MAG: RidA family protein [Planctomycetota bacterium]
MSIEERLAELNLELPPTPKPAGVYRPIVVVDNLAYLSGHLPLLPGGGLMTGRVGADVSQEDGYEAARRTALAMLRTLKDELGQLDRVARVIKILGMVNCTADFHAQPGVINGCSELLAEVFGSEIGVGARSAVGVAALPLNVTVEIEGIFAVK